MLAIHIYILYMPTAHSLEIHTSQPGTFIRIYTDYKQRLHFLLKYRSDIASKHHRK